MAPDIMIITNQRAVPVQVPSPDPRYSPIVIGPGETRAVDAPEGWAEKICLQIKGLICKRGGY